VHVQAVGQLEEQGDGPLILQLRLGYPNLPCCRCGSAIVDDGRQPVRGLAGPGVTAGYFADSDPRRAHRQALAEAAKTLDLTRVLDVLRNYHRIAWLTQQQGTETHRRMLNKAAEILRTGENPDGVALKDVKALIHDRLARRDSVRDPSRAATGQGCGL
jgi:Family of unknown function (DUF6247)